MQQVVSFYFFSLKVANSKGEMILQKALQSDNVPVPDYCVIHSANSYGKRVYGVKHTNKKAQGGSFLVYDYGDTYTFQKKAIERAVGVISQSVVN